MDPAASQDSQAVDDQSPRAPEQIRADIEETRREVGDTAAALAEKADVKSQAKTRIERVKGRIQSRRAESVERLKSKRAESVERVKAATPESAGQAASTVSTTARENPVPIAIAAAAVVGFALGRMAGRR